jgi:CHAT domain-containing protein
MRVQQILLAWACASVLAAQSLPDAQPLKLGTVVERELSNTQSHAYRLKLGGGGYAGLRIAQRGVDIVVQVRDPAGKLVAEFDSESRTHGQEAVGVLAESPSEFELRIQARYPMIAAGGYELRVVELRLATARDRAIFQAHELSTEANRLEEDGNYDQAMAIAARALSVGEEALGPDDSYTGYLLFRVASLKRIKGDFAEGERIFERAIAVSQKALGREHPQTALALRGLGRIYMATNQYAKAGALLEEQIGIFERTLGTVHPSVASGLRALAVLHEYLANLARAETELQRAMAIAGQTLPPDDITAISILHDLGDLYWRMGDNQRAEPIIRRELAILEKKEGPEHPHLCPPLQNLGIIARQKHEYGSALELLSRSLAIKEKAFGRRNLDTAGLLVNIANVYGDQGEYAKALQGHLEALEILQAVGGPYHPSTLLVMGNVARAFAANRQISQAIEYEKRFNEALEKNLAINLAIGSDREKLAYLNGWSRRTDRTISLNVREAPDRQDAAEIAVLTLLQRKGRVLDAMSNGIRALHERASPEDRRLFEELDQANSTLAKLALNGPGKTPTEEYRKRLAAIEDRREKLEAGISGRSAEFRAQAQPVTLAATRAAIPPAAALIELGRFHSADSRDSNRYEEADANYIAYVVRRQGEVRFHDLGPVKNIDDSVAALRAALGDPRRSDVSELARALDRKITQPIRQMLAGASQLLIAPEGSLNTIPFEALIDESGRHLVERYSISYLTAGRDLLRQQVARASKTGPVILADPLFGEPETALAGTSPASRRSITTGANLSSVYFAPLPGTAEEARSIQSLFPEAEILTGRQASKASLKRLEAPAILHIATHGFFLDDPSGHTAGQPARSGKLEDPLIRSGLALAGANQIKSGSDDGILTALEASNLNLWGTRIVTLSACETAVGQVRNGEGVYGLRRAFLLAGTETLVMSLWAVSDRMTREMMVAYYTGLKQGLGRGEALRQAQLAMLKRKDRQHPYYWAGFIQLGDWTSLQGK